MTADMQVPMSKLASQITINVAVVGARAFGVRAWLTTWILKAAAVVSGCRVMRVDIDTHSAVVVGDRFLFSVALLKDIHERPDHESHVVELVEVRTSTEVEGAKVLVLQRHG